MFEKYASGSPSKRHPISLNFAFSSIDHIAATFFGSGVIHPASGTWGTLAGLLFYIVLEPFVPLWAWVVIIVATLFYGAWACEVTGRDIGVHDHSSIVIDEVFAIWMVLVTLPSDTFWQIGAFLAFRFFDIVKLPPAKWFDTSPRWQNGMGVMLDDFVAGVQAIILLQFIRYIV